VNWNSLKTLPVIAISLLVPLNAHAIELKVGFCGFISTMVGITHFRGKVGVEYLVCDGSTELTSSLFSITDEDPIYFRDQYLNLLFSFSEHIRNGGYLGIGIIKSDGESENISNGETVKDSSTGISVFLGYDFGWLSGRIGWISDGLLEFEKDTGGGTTEIESLERNGLFQLLLNIPL